MLSEIDNKDPDVDIILPNYNNGKYLKETINSIIAQTYENWKLFIIDDNSQDNSKEIIGNYKNEKINIVYLFKNKGVAFCRNLAIRLSNSKYIAFIDSDDYWSQNKLKEQILFMEKFNHEFTYTNYTPFIVKKNIKVFKKKNKIENKKIKLQIVKRIETTKTELRKLQDLYSTPGQLTKEVKLQVAKKIETKRSELEKLYSDPYGYISSKKMRRWAGLQVVKVFLGIPILPGK